MKVAIVKYNAGNIYSVVHSMKRLGVEPVVTDDVPTLRSADRVLFPDRERRVRQWDTCVNMDSTRSSAR